MDKRVMVINDLSGFGNTSLMAIIPTLYSFGLALCVLPTSLLTANTCFADYHMQGTDDFMRQSIAHWQALKMEFSAIYSGFLANTEQVDIVLHAIDAFADEDCLVLIDPVMADGGELYSCYDESMIQAMRRLVARADIISPNYTEACFLADVPCRQKCTDASLQELCAKLHKLGAKELVITSVPYEKESNDVLYSSGQDFELFKTAYLPCFYTGTGDIFSTLMVAYRLQAMDIREAISRATKTIYKAIELSQAAGQSGAEGVLWEQILCQKSQN
ncbi:MAG: pyridoxamine kinase [Candidatus Cloacimonetes bacterium]|nr:pyridoxamine kinase [Candidatus Cloacimonadota bacterium]MDD2423538.1 pyridoxamine kinase [Candidatus Cloacimonadota bacterium]MDD3562063.1 pyridoxamine kinase [Candidatus Cloacimonadota bacterium]MDD4277060.1 pyridoxamine kinase [Candidatus Cloacimonadota bacterium]